MRRFLQVFCPFFSGVALALAIPNEFLKAGAPPVALLALVPFFVALARARGYGEAFAAGWIQAFTAHVLSSFWLGNFRGYALFTLGASAVGTGFICAFSSLVFFFPFSRLNAGRRLREEAGTDARALPLRVFWLAGTYTVWEWAKSFGFLAYPWGTLSMAAFTWPLVTQVADLTGPYGVTFLFALVSALAAEGLLLLPRLGHAACPRALRSAWAACAKTCAALAAATVLYGAYQYFLPRRPVKMLNAALVQQNLDPWDDGDEEAIAVSARLSQEKIDEFAARGKSCDLVVWSEGVLSRRFPDAQSYYRYFPEDKPLIPFIKSTQTPFIIGAPLTVDRGKRQYGNAAVLLDGSGEYRGAYLKMHLVPFAERIPFVEYEAVRAFIKKIAGFSYGWIQGSVPVLFEIPLSTPPLRGPEVVSLAGRDAETATVMVATPICFDDAFGEVCRSLHRAGSEVFINLTNDAWSRTESAEIQHFAVASYRAIEYRTTLARATNGGLTAVVDPAGRVLQALPLFEEGALAAEIPVYERTTTIYARFGDWLVAVLALLAAAHVVLLTAEERANKIS